MLLEIFKYALLVQKFRTNKKFRIYLFIINAFI